MSGAAMSVSRITLRPATMLSFAVVVSCSAFPLLVSPGTVPGHSGIGFRGADQAAAARVMAITNGRSMIDCLRAYLNRRGGPDATARRAVERLQRCQLRCTEWFVW